MNSLPTSIVEQQPHDDAPLAASAGVPGKRGRESSLEQWIDLMEAVEALCPRWPVREVRVGGTYRL